MPFYRVFFFYKDKEEITNNVCARIKPDNLF